MRLFIDMRALRSGEKVYNRQVGNGSDYPWLAKPGSVRAVACVGRGVN